MEGNPDEEEMDAHSEQKSLLIQHDITQALFPSPAIGLVVL